MFFEGCDNPKAMRDRIKEFLDDREKFLATYGTERPPTWTLESMRGLLDLGPGGASWAEHDSDRDVRLGKAVHQDACTRALAFRQEDPQLPQIPVEATDPIAGLHLIMQWCIDAGTMHGGRGGRKPGHDKRFWRLVRKTYDDCCEDGMDSKGAWNEAADTHGLPSGDAARMGWRRNLSRNRNNEQN